MPFVYDFNRVPGPSPDEVKGADGQGSLIYGTGAQQSDDWVHDHESADLHVVRIWEHNTDSILGGYNYGVSECKAFEDANPPGLVYLACDLNDGALAGRSVVPFCNGWCDTTREATVGLYGPDHAILDGIAMNRPKLSKWWGVVNWLDGGYPDNDPRNIARWTEIGAHLIQLIGSPIPDTDQNLILRDDWWTAGPVAPSNPYLEYQMDEFFATDPADRRNIWWFSGAGRRHISAGEWQAIAAQAAFRQLPPPKPFAGTPEMFAAPDVTSFAGGSSGAGSFTVTSTVVAA